MKVLIGILLWIIIGLIAVYLNDYYLHGYCDGIKESCEKLLNRRNHEPLPDGYYKTIFVWIHIYYVLLWPILFIIDLKVFIKVLSKWFK